MPETMTIRGEGISVDLLLWRKYGVRGRSLVETMLADNPGLAEAGPFIPPGRVVVIPDLPTASTADVRRVSLFSAG